MKRFEKEPQTPDSPDLKEQAERARASSFSLDELSSKIRLINDNISDSKLQPFRPYSCELSEPFRYYTFFFILLGIIPAISLMSYLLYISLSFMTHYSITLLLLILYVLNKLLFLLIDYLGVHERNKFCTIH